METKSWLSMPASAYSIPGVLNLSDSVALFPFGLLSDGLSSVVGRYRFADLSDSVGLISGMRFSAIALVQVDTDDGK